MKTEVRDSDSCSNNQATKKCLHSTLDLHKQQKVVWSHQLRWTIYFSTDQTPQRYIEWTEEDPNTLQYGTQETYAQQPLPYSYTSSGTHGRWTPHYTNTYDQALDEDATLANYQKPHWSEVEDMRHL